MATSSFFFFLLSWVTYQMQDTLRWHEKMQAQGELVLVENGVSAQQPVARQQDYLGSRINPS